MTGLVQVYTGEGKGKTTAAMGLALRAAGHGMKVYIVQFLKNGRSGEICTLRKIKGVRILCTGGCSSPLKSPTEPERNQLRAEFKNTLSECTKIMESGKYDILILDEINVAMKKGLINQNAVIDLLSKRPEGVEIVLTGRGAPRKIVELADLVTRMEEVKHPFKKGIKQRKGVEY